MAEMSKAEIEQAVKAARYCARANPGGCSECGEDGRFCFGVMAPENGIPLVVLALASKLDATTAERDELRAEVERLKAMLDTIATGDWGALPDSMGLSCEFGEDARYNH